MAKTKKDSIVKAPKKEAPIYSVTISLNGVDETHEADSVFEALQAFGRPKIIKNGAELSISKGDKTKTRTYQSYQARRLLWNSAALKILASDLTAELG